MEQIQSNTTTNTNLGACRLSANALKLIAIVAMVIDHVGTGFFAFGTAPYVVMHLLGRTTGPTMFYFVAVGYRHTRNANRYTLRLAVFALVSYLPYIYFHTGALPTAGTWMQMNVIYTLLLGLLAIRAQHEVKPLAQRFPILIVLFMLSTYGDWGTTALFFMLALDYFHDNRTQQSFAYLLVAAAASGLLQPFTYPLFALRNDDLDMSSYPGTLCYLGLLIPLILLQFYSGERGRGGKLAKWGFYVVYPLHFLMLGFIKFTLMA